MTKNFPLEFSASENKVEISAKSNDRKLVTKAGLTIDSSDLEEIHLSAFVTRSDVKLMLNKLWGLIIHPPSSVKEIMKPDAPNYMSGLDSESEELLKKFLKYVLFEKADSSYAVIEEILRDWYDEFNDRIDQKKTQKERTKIIAKNKFLIEIRQKLEINKNSEIETKSEPQEENKSPEINQNSITLAQNKLIEGIIADANNNQEKAQKLYDEAQKLVYKKPEELLQTQTKLSEENKIRNFIYYNSFALSHEEFCPQKVLDYLENMMDFGSTDASNDMAITYDGEFPSHCKEIYRLYKTSINQGYEDSEYKMGEIFHKNFPPSFLFETIRYYESAAAKGHPKAHYHLFLIYFDLAGEKNLVKAYQHYKSSSKSVKKDLAPLIQNIETTIIHYFTSDLTNLQTKLAEKVESERNVEDLKEIEKLLERCLQSRKAMIAIELTPKAEDTELLRKVRTYFSFHKEELKSAISSNEIEDLISLKNVELPEIEEKQSEESEKNKQELKDKFEANILLLKEMMESSLSQDELNKLSESLTILRLDEYQVKVQNLNDLMPEKAQLISKFASLYDECLAYLQNEENAKKYLDDIETLITIKQAENVTQYLENISEITEEILECPIALDLSNQHYKSEYKYFLEKHPTVQVAQAYQQIMSYNQVPAAQTDLGARYLFGYNIKQDRVKGEILIKAAASVGYGEAQSDLGCLYLNDQICLEKLTPNERFQSARKYFELAGIQGSSEAYCNLGTMYLMGNGVPKDREAAKKYFKLSSDQGNRVGSNNMATALREEEDYAQAVEYYELALSRGHKEALNELAIIFYKGTKASKKFKAVPQDLAKSFSYYMQSAEKGSILAMERVGFMYLKGEGTPLDKEKGIYYLELSAQGGNEVARSVLIQEYEVQKKFRKLYLHSKLLVMNNSECLIRENGETTIRNNKVLEERLERSKKSWSIGFLFDVDKLDKNLKSSKKDIKLIKELCEKCLEYIDFYDEKKDLEAPSPSAFRIIKNAEIFLSSLNEEKKSPEKPKLPQLPAQSISPKKKEKVITPKIKNAAEIEAQKEADIIYQISMALLLGQPLKLQAKDSIKFAATDILNTQNKQYVLHQLNPNHQQLLKDALKYILLDKNGGELQNFSSYLKQWNEQLNQKLEEIKDFPQDKKTQEIEEFLQQNELIKELRTKFSIQNKKSENKSDNSPSSKNSFQNHFIEGLFFENSGNKEKALQAYMEAQQSILSDKSDQNSTPEIQLIKNNFKIEAYYKIHDFYCRNYPQEVAAYKARMSKNIARTEFDLALIYYEKYRQNSLDLLEKSLTFTELKNCEKHLEQDNLKKDRQKALEFLEKSAQKGFERSQYLLAMTYIYGQEDIQNIEKGKELLEIAAKKGLMKAKCELAILLIAEADQENNEAEKPKILAKAQKFLEEIEDQTFGKAQYYLAQLYQKNGELKKAKKCYGAAIKNGIKEDSQYHYTVLCLENEEIFQQTLKEIEISAQEYDESKGSRDNSPSHKSGEKLFEIEKKRPNDFKSLTKKCYRTSINQIYKEDAQYNYAILCLENEKILKQDLKKICLYLFDFIENPRFPQAVKKFRETEKKWTEEFKETAKKLNIALEKPESSTEEIRELYLKYRSYVQAHRHHKIKITDPEAFKIIYEDNLQKKTEEILLKKILEEKEEEKKVENLSLTDKEIKEKYKEALRDYKNNNFAQAAKTFTKLAQVNHDKSQYYLALMHQKGQIDGETNLAEAARLYREAAKNLPEAKYKLAKLHLNLNPKEAEILFKEAAEQDHAKAKYHLGILCYEKNPQETEKLFKSIADGNELNTKQKNYITHAQFSLAVILQGKGDTKKAANYYRLAASANYAPAQFNLALMYEDGIGVDKNITEALRLYRLAANQDLKEAQLNLLCILRSLNQKFDEVEKLFQLITKDGNAEEQYNLGLLLSEAEFEGKNLKPDFKKAAQFFKLAADKNHAGAQLHLAQIYEQGLGVEKNSSEAFKFYRAAAKKGLKEAQFNLMKIWNNLDKTPEAIDGIIQLIITEGSVDEQYNLGLKLSEFKNCSAEVKKNLERKTAELFMLAIEKSHINALYQLGNCYLKGEGVKKDYKKSALCFAKAAKYGDLKARKFIEEMQIEAAKNDSSIESQIISQEINLISQKDEAKPRKFYKPIKIAQNPYQKKEGNTKLYEEVTEFKDNINILCKELFGNKTIKALEIEWMQKLYFKCKEFYQKFYDPTGQKLYLNSPDIDNKTQEKFNDVRIIFQNLNPEISGFLYEVSQQKAAEEYWKEALYRNALEQKAVQENRRVEQQQKKSQDFKRSTKSENSRNMEEIKERSDNKKILEIQEMKRPRRNYNQFRINYSGGMLGKFSRSKIVPSPILETTTNNFTVAAHFNDSASTISQVIADCPTIIRICSKVKIEQNKMAIPQVAISPQSCAKFDTSQNLLER